MHRPSDSLTDPSRNMEESNGPFPQDTASMQVDSEESDQPQDLRPGDATSSTQPPPRIANRFYKPSHARRKGSAASSRRNSISSAHSRCSSVHQSNDTLGQSKYVAQHLRRASFLEDRLARLADRAAHAEKVRLRAAMAKAPKGITNSEERAMAAQLAREKNLAEIVANCAEEVKKAKQVAEQTREKREQEMVRLRQQMQDRMADAEKRREQLRSQSASRRSRGQSVAARKPIERVSPVPEQPVRQMTQADAASRIQHWWRAHQRWRAIQEFNSLGLSVDGIRDTSFDTVTELLNQDKVMTVAVRLLRLCGLQEGEVGSVEELTAARIFLSAYLILGHPNQVLSNKGGHGDEADSNSISPPQLPAADLDDSQLQDLINKAKDLLVLFENTLSRLTVTNRYVTPPTLQKALPDSYAVFHNAFISWKSRDSNALVEVMLLQFVELDAILQTIKEQTDDGAGEVYRQSIRDNQLMLLVRIKRLVGQDEGKRMVFAAVAEARKKARREKRAVGDTKPRVAENASLEASATAASMTSTTASMMTPPSTPSSHGQHHPKSTPLPAGGMQGLLEDNRVVTHELAINKEYQIPVEVYKEKTASWLRPLYAQMRRDYEDNNRLANFQSFVFVIKNIKEKLQRLLKDGNSMHKLIGELVDPEMSRRQFEMGSFSYEKFFHDMSTILPKLCAPFRDDEVKELVQTTLRDGDLIDRVEALNGFIDTMLCDYVNYMMRLVAPQLIEAAPQYESKRFGEELSKGDLTLRAAQASWRSAQAKLAAEAQKRDPEGINHPKSRLTPGRVYAQLLVDVFTQPTPYDPAAIPEMLQLDLSRIDEVSKTIRQIVAAGAILLQCKNVMKRDVRSAWKSEATRIMTVLQAKHESLDTAVDGTMAALEAGRSMPAASKKQTRALVLRILTAERAMASESVEPGEPVMRLLLTRLRSIMLTRLSPGSASDKVKTATTSSEKLSSLGLPEFVDKVRQVCNLLERIGNVDRSAHSSWWDIVATEAMQD